MNTIIQNIRDRAAKLKRQIVLPEGDDPRVLKAAQFLVDEGVCQVTVLCRDTVSTSDQFTTLNYLEDTTRTEIYADALWEKRKQKLEGREEVKKLLQNPLYYGASMVNAGLADGCVAGSIATTAEVIRAAIQVIGLKENSNIVSSIFLMAIPGGQTYTYADCGVVPYPDEQQLADIAIRSARTHQLLTGQQPKVAMLSFSTKGSAPHPRSQLVADALAIVQAKNPELTIDGELQFDAAFVPEIARQKAPGSPLKGAANVFIFPNLDAGNIAYKITEGLAGATATGPIVQGLAKPMMDLSRGCSWQDIVNVVCVAILLGGE